MAYRLRRSQSQAASYEPLPIMKSHKDLDVWKKAVDLFVDICRLTETFPREEVYAISNQMRRAAVSVASNITEGAARRTDKGFIHFLHISSGSAREPDTQVEIAGCIGFTDGEKASEIQNRDGEVLRMIYGLIRLVENKKHD